MPNIDEREHSIGLFDELICRGAGTVVLVSGPNPHLVVVGPEELIDRVVVRYRGMRLVIGYRVGPSPLPLIQNLSQQVRIIVVTDALSRVVVQGAASLQFGESPERPFTTEGIKIISSGSGFISGTLSTGTLAIRLRGMGGLQLGGDAELLDARLSGIGTLECGELVCKKARVNISGVGSSRVMVLDHLTATVSGTGRLLYRGSPQVTRRGIAGRIERMEE